MPRLCGLIAGMIVIVGGVASGQTVDVTVDADGRLVNLPVASTEPTTLVRIHVLGVPAGESFEVRYRSLNNPDNTAAPALSDLLATEDGENQFSIQLGASRPSFLLYSIARRVAGLTPAERTKLEEELKRLQAELAQAQKALNSSPAQAAVTSAQAVFSAAETTATASTTAARAEIKRAEGEIAALWEDIKVFGQRESDAAVAEIIRLEGEIRKLRAAIAAQQKIIETNTASLVPAQAALSKAQAALKASPESTEVATLQARETAIETQLEPRTTLTLRRLGLLVLQPSARVAYYRTTLGSRENAVALERISPVPVATTENELFAVIVNRQLSTFPEPFALKYTLTERAPENPTPVRPVFSVEAGKKETVAKAPPPPYAGLDTAYRDFVMPFGRRFRANTVLTVDISSYMQVVTQDERTTAAKSPPDKDQPGLQTTTTQKSESKRVSLLTNEEYPPIRGLYRFNFTAGVIGSWLRNPTFVRSKTQLNNPATDGDETRYQTDEVKGDVRAIPVFGLTVYTRPVDIYAPVSWYERLVPAPTIAFSFQDPHENVFIGGAHEAMRNLQVWWGLHFGKINTLQKTNAADDPTSNAAPGVEERFRTAGYLGVSFNLNAIRTIFGGS